MVTKTQWVLLFPSSSKENVNSLTYKFADLLTLFLWCIRLNYQSISLTTCNIKRIPLPLFLIFSLSPSLPSSLSYPCSCRFIRASLFTSAITPIQPEITAALACAPLIPPRPEVTKTLPDKSPLPRYFLPAFRTVSYIKKKHFVSKNHLPSLKVMHVHVIIAIIILTIIIIFTVVPCTIPCGPM